jgi:hypothetical protein
MEIENELPSAPLLYPVCISCFNSLLASVYTGNIKRDGIK